ncbi:RNI-like protein [Mycena alexandri]|uniref:RNI-like protein n=1 Tax=Mycena alexandri TaxID=1745969 RepID=A0AAD6TAL3_9AGAR|nr:RNI-like protein [Mycena alexandri]
MSRNKRARTGPSREFGAATEDDSPSAGTRDPSSSALSTRSPRYTTVPTLTTLCSRVFAANFVKLRNNERVWQEVSVYLKAMPEPLLPRLLAELVRVCSTYLKHEFLVAYFFRGHTLVLSDGLPGVQIHTVRALERMPDLRELELSGFAKIPDAAFASVLPRLASLKRLVLRGCALVGTKTLGAAASCTHLQVLNLNYTAVTPISLVGVLKACPNLEVLKLAGIVNWTDAACAKLLDGLSDNAPFMIPKLHTLKLARLAISETTFNEIIPMCPALLRLDISFTSVRHPLLSLGDAKPLPPLEKLSLTSTPTSNSDLMALLPRLPNLKTLAIGALGASPRSIAAIDSSMSFTDGALLNVVPLLAAHKLESVSLVGNAKLGAALGVFIAEVGRNCKWLNLSGLPSLRSAHLAGLVPIDGAPPARLETLMLNHTGIDDDAAPFLAACPSLAWLEVAETKMTGDGLFLVLDGCPLLATLGLRSCRGVPVGDRRRFFEAWEESRVNA